jgi:predicted nucleic acid-binding protein
MKIFVDTWGWVAVADKKDAYHQEAVNTYNAQVLSDENSLVTSEFVLMETITHLRQRIGHTRTMKWTNTVLEEESLGNVTIVDAEHSLWRKSFTLLQRYADKPEISFVDFTSFVIMQELNITDVFSGDKHFEQVNLGFKILR